MSKKSFIVISAFLLFGVSLVLPRTVSAADEAIREFSVDILVNQDSSLMIAETIIYDFGENIKFNIKILDIKDGK